MVGQPVTAHQRPRWPAYSPVLFLPTSSSKSAPNPSELSPQSCALFVGGWGSREICRGAKRDQARHQSQPSAIRGHACHAKAMSMSPSATMCHACHVKATSMPPNATAATQKCQRDQARHQTQPSAISVTLAAQKRHPCHQVPRLPRKSNVNAAPATQKCHGAKRDQARHQTQPSATPAAQKQRRCHQVQQLCVCKLLVTCSINGLFVLSSRGITGTFGLAWYNKAPAMRQDMIEGRWGTPRSRSCYW